MARGWACFQFPDSHRASLWQHFFPTSLEQEIEFCQSNGFFSTLHSFPNTETQLGHVSSKSLAPLMEGLQPVPGRIWCPRLGSIFSRLNNSLLIWTQGHFWALDFFYQNQGVFAQAGSLPYHFWDVAFDEFFCYQNRLPLGENHQLHQGRSSLRSIAKHSRSYIPKVKGLQWPVPFRKQ